MLDTYTRRDIISLVGAATLFSNINSVSGTFLDNNTSKNAPWPVLGGDPKNKKSKSGEVGPTREISEDWTISLSDYTGKRGSGPITYPSPIIADQTLFIDGNAINIADGTTRWLSDWDATPCYHDGKLITREDDRLVARDSQDGDKIYDRKVSANFLHVSVVGDVLYTGAPNVGSKALLTARNAHTGDVISETTTIEQDEEDAEYYYRVSSSHPPVFSEDTAVLAFHRQYEDSIVWRWMSGSIDLNTEKIQEYPVGTSPAIVDGTLFSADSINRGRDKIFAREVVSGNKQWEYDIRGEITGPAVTRDHVIIGTDEDNSRVISLNPVDGTEQWSTELDPIATPPVIVGSQAIVGSKQGKIISVSLENGNVQWEQDTDHTLHRSSLAVGHGRLVVSGEDGGISVFNDVENTAPDAEIDYDPRTPVTGETVRFDALGSTDEHSIESYEWNFGEGEDFETSGPVVEQTFEAAGDVPVQLRVTDEFGKTDEAGLSVSVVEPDDPPTATFAISPEEPRTGESVTFDASAAVSTDGSIVAYEWEFDDGVSETGETIERTFDDPGEYPVTLRVQDDNGLQSTEQRVVAVVRQRINVLLTGSSVETEVGEVETVTLSITNFLTSDELTAQLLIETPAGVEVRGVRGAEQGSNQYTATATLAPSGQENIQIDLVANDPGNHELTAIVDYFFNANPDDTGRHIEDITISTHATARENDNGNQGNAPDSESDNSFLDEVGSGFNIGSALAGIGSGFYLLKRRLSNNRENK